MSTFSLPVNTHMDSPIITSTTGNTTISGTCSIGNLSVTAAGTSFNVSNAATIGSLVLGNSPLPITSGGTASSSGLSGSSIMISNGTSIIQGAAGTTTTLLHGNASGSPTFSAVVLTTDVSGILPIANGGTNSGTQNFVDLTTGQSVGGVKTFTSVPVSSGLTAPAATSFAFTANQTTTSTPAIVFNNAGTDFAGHYVYDFQNNSNHMLQIGIDSSSNGAWIQGYDHSGTATAGVQFYSGAVGPSTSNLMLGNAAHSWEGLYIGQSTISTFAFTAVATAATVGTTVVNTTAAAVNAQQYSPVMELSGRGWKTATTAASQTVAFGLQCQPVQGTANPTGLLSFMTNINAAGYTAISTFDSKGRLHTGINGTAQTSGQFALSAGWGSTATVGTISGTDSKMTYTITSSGTGQAASPTTTITYADGTWTTVPFGSTHLIASNDTTLTGASLNNDATTATTDIITVVLLGALGTQAPVSGKTYTFSTITVGI